MNRQLMAFAVALCAVVPGAALYADDGVDLGPSSPSGYGVIHSWADQAEMPDTDGIDVEALSDGGYTVIRTSWVPPEQGGWSVYPLPDMFRELLAKAGGGTVTAYEGTRREGQGHLVVFWGKVSADDAVLCAGFGSYETHGANDSRHKVPNETSDCPP
ncbi:MAG: hypothetical protein OXT64_08130 [Gammaproteobacteria bacterium]|nr:hypothetical protein [Gammaproteobacteria bacterium]